MDELLAALRAEFPGLKWEKAGRGYQAEFAGGMIAADEDARKGWAVLMDSGWAEVLTQEWRTDRATALARFHRKLRLAATVVAAAVEVSDGK